MILFEKLYHYSVELEKKRSVIVTKDQMVTGYGCERGSETSGWVRRCCCWSSLAKRSGVRIGMT